MSIGPVSTTNDFFVAVQRDHIIVMKPLPGVLTRAQALNLAAWLEALADPAGEKFPLVQMMVRNT